MTNTDLSFTSQVIAYPKYLLGNFFQGTKATVATISLVGSGMVLGWGILASKTVFIIGGSFGLLAPGLLLLDSSVLTRKMRQTFEKIRDQTALLQQHVTVFDHQNQELSRQNLKLSASLNQLQQTQAKLAKNVSELETSAQAAQAQVVKLESLRQAYLESNQHLDQENQAYQQQNTELQTKLLALGEQLGHLETIKNTYLNQNLELQNSLGDQAEQVEYLRDQVTKLQDLYKNARLLLINLATAGDVFNQFSQVMDGHLTGLQTTNNNLEQTQGGLQLTLNAMNSLLFKLKEAKFAQLDSNQDGLISAQEFSDNIQRL